jgi:GT2 family glycosyltransferase
LDLSIIIVNWNTDSVLSNCLDSLYESIRKSSLSIETILVDNNSTDDSLHGVVENNLNPKILRQSENLGFGKACNRGAMEASGKYLLFLNPDTLIVENAVNDLFSFMENHRDVGIAGPQLVDPDGVLQPSASPRLELRSELLHLFHLNAINPFNQYRMDSWNKQTAREVEVLQGACLIVRQEVFIDLGGFDERFFMYTEEVDLCFRCRQEGWKIIWVPWIRVLHIGGHSTSQKEEMMFLELYRSKIEYFRKHRNNQSVILYKLLLFVVALTRQIPLINRVIPGKTLDRRVTAYYYRRLISHLSEF